MTVTYTVGDTREVIKGIADGGVDLIASSPPFLALRSYVPEGHESKGDEIGSERNPAEFIDMLLGLTAEWGRVLAAHGSIAIELGDTYSGSGGAGGDYNDGGLRDGQGVWESQAARARAWKMDPSASGGYQRGKQIRPGGTNGNHWPRAKSLALIPQLYAVALAYGINPLTGQPSPAGRWLVRNVIVWHRPNPAVGALGDKVRPSTSYIVVATRSAKRWYDLTAVRTPHTVANAGPLRGRSAGAPAGSGTDVGAIWESGERMSINPAGAPPLDAWFDEYDTAQIVEGEGGRELSAVAPVASPSTLSPYDGSHDTWTLTTQPSRLAHYAMWPAKLAERLILSMCPREVCDALVCKSCGHTHELRNSQLNTFAMGADEQQLPISPALQEDLRRVRDLLRGPQSVDVQQAVSVQTGPTEAGKALQLQGRQDQPQGLYPSVDAGLPVGDDGEGVRTRASLRDGTTPGTPAREARTRASQERREGRQSAREPAGDDERDASRRGDLPELRSRLLDSLTCTCGAQGFVVCGEPRRRIEGISFTSHGNGRVDEAKGSRTRADGVVLDYAQHMEHGRATKNVETLGWTDCGHDNYRPGLTLDPFAGSGTTLAVADLHGRDAIGIDFDARNKAIYPARYDEVKRALYGTPAPMPGQETFDFEEVAG